MRFSFGMRQLLKMSSVVDDARMPILFSFLPKVNPGVPFSTMKAEAPRAPLDLSVMAMTVYIWASPPFVIHCLVPFSTYSLPSSFAVVWMPLASLPAFASVRPNAARFFPDAMSGRYFFFCASLPWRRMG